MPTAIHCVGMCSTSFNEWFFTPEGDRIPRDTRPTYWHHPELDKPEHQKRFQDWLRSLPKSGDSATPCCVPGMMPMMLAAAGPKKGLAGAAAGPTATGTATRRSTGTSPPSGG